MSWFSLIRYLEFNTQFYLLILSIRAALSKVVKFIIMCVPLYMGYALVGVFCLSDHDDFATFFNSLRTLFALLNGDSILLEYQTLCDQTSFMYCLFAQFYLYTFCVLFITTVLNVFIFIIEDGYHHAQEARHSQIINHNDATSGCEMCFLRPAFVCRWSQLKHVSNPDKYLKSLL